MLRPVSRCARQCSSIYASPASRRRPRQDLLKSDALVRSLRTAAAAGVRTAAGAPPCVRRRLGRHSSPLSPCACRRALLSTTSGHGDDDRDSGKDKAVTGSTTTSEQVDVKPDADPKASAGILLHISALALTDQARRLLELARPESKLIGGAIVLLLGSTTISLAVPKVMGGLIDSVMQGTGAYTPWEAAGILMALFGAQSIMLTGRSGLMTVAGERVAARLRNLAFGSMVVQETAFFDRNRTGDLVNRLASDVLLVQGSVTTSAAQVQYCRAEHT
ncbi:unnamed protein product [Ectocarpus fasciculatus]